MSDRIRHASHQRRHALRSGWSLCAAPARAAITPAQLAELPAASWTELASPGLVADALRAAGLWSVDNPPRRLDADDWWFRLRFDAPAALPDAQRCLAIGGLAGRAELWLNGQPLPGSDNMFVAQSIAEPPLRSAGNELLMRFGALDAWLAQRRPRPRWRAPMVEHQQLRWTRASLLGRTPGWSPPAPPIGPWREIELVDEQHVAVSDLRLQTRLEGTQGKVELTIRLAPTTRAIHIARAHLELEREGIVHRVALQADTTATRYAASLTVPDAAPWWPHTHGRPALYTARIVVQTSSADHPIRLDLGALGFRHLALATDGGDFTLHANGVRIFCRGACWTPLDVVSLRSSEADCRRALTQVRDAGMNMLRVSGSMVYEADHFYALCDELGILVWQDFMFANMDYPLDDPAFSTSVQAEVQQQLARWQAHPSLAVLCGNSEAEQQAAMWGAPREQWSQPFFTRDLPELVAAWCPGVAYWPSSAHGGAFPHQADAGTSSYYGVGAYLRPLDDARQSGLRFATECLAFAHVPPASTLARMPGGAALRSHHAGWKARSPRDLGAGWDFDDVRDHYLQRLYGTDPAALRASDHDRYLALSRAASSEVVHASMAEWRRAASRCGGALVWFLRDLWAGAGWGLLDDQGAPKAAFHGLKRACAPVAMFITDEGVNGLALHLVNDTPQPLAATLDIALYRDDGLLMAQPAQAHRVAAHSAAEWPVAAWFDHFVDLSRAYRFGPAEHALVVATLRASDAAPGDEPLAQAFHFPEGLPSRAAREIGLAARARLLADGTAELLIETRGFAQSVHVDVPGFVADDEFFHLAPGSQRRLRLRAAQPATQPALRGSVLALNSLCAAPLEIA